MILIACIFSIFAKPPEHVKVADEVMNAFNASCATRYHIQPLQQSGLFEKGIEALFLDYQIQEPMEEAKAKKLLSDLTEEFLKFVNQTEKIQSYLLSHPFTNQQISISVHLPFQLVAQDALASAEISGEIISFYYKRAQEKRPVLLKKEIVK